MLLPIGVAWIGFDATGLSLAAWRELAPDRDEFVAPELGKDGNNG